jgi:hypothetical protein
MPGPIAGVDFNPHDEKPTYNRYQQFSCDDGRCTQTMQDVIGNDLRG